jgi:hypothetical protein
MGDDGPGVPAPAGRPKEQEIAVPARPAATAVAVAAAGSAAAAFGALYLLTENPPGRAMATAVGVAGCAAITLGTGFIFYGSRPRPAGDVQTRWMGATVARFMAVPALGLSIYFFLPSGGQFAVLATLGTYLACLAAETATVAWMVNRSLERPRT